jgi:hypothetical protein
MNEPRRAEIRLLSQFLSDTQSKIERLSEHETEDGEDRPDNLDTMRTEHEDAAAYLADAAENIEKAVELLEKAASVRH